MSQFRQVRPDGSGEPLIRTVAEEIPVALEYGGVGYAVLMASPANLEDLAYGFSLSDRLIDHADEIIGIEPHETPVGIILRIALPGNRMDRIVDRVRHRATDASCGLCGIENLEQAMRPLPRVTSQCRADERAIFRALAELPGYQPLNAATGAVHVAAACDATGAIRLAREDVGRHNAFDKLIGAMMRAGMEWDSGFALLSSRCSYELIEKAALSGCPMLVTISAPTRLAIHRAQEAGVRLAVLARPDAVLFVSDRAG